MKLLDQSNINRKCRNLNSALRSLLEAQLLTSTLSVIATQPTELPVLVCVLGHPYINPSVALAPSY